MKIELTQEELTQEELTELKQVQRNVTGTDYIKVTGIPTLHGGFLPHTVSESPGIDVSTVYRYAALYSSGGLTALTANRYKGYWGMLPSHETSLLRAKLKRSIYTDSQGISSWIKTSFGVFHTSAGVVEPLNRIGFTYKKTKEIPCEGSTEKQEAFVWKLPEIIAGMDKTSVIYCADGVHPTRNSRPAYAYVICNVGYLAAIQARASVNKDKTAIKSELLSLNLSVDQFVEEVWKEKIREFIFEFKLWNDITRTRKYPAADSDGTFHFVDLIGAENPFGHTFTEDKIYFPICSQELQRNPALTETPE